jgi:hypothetical protein
VSKSLKHTFIFSSFSYIQNGVFAPCSAQLCLKRQSDEIFAEKLENISDFATQRRVDSTLRSIARSRQKKGWLKFHTELHRAKSQIIFFLLRAMQISAEFFCTAWSLNANGSACVTAVKAKMDHRWSYLPHGSKIKLKETKRNSTQRYAAQSRVDFRSRISPRIRKYIRNRSSPWISGPRGIVWRKKPEVKISWDCPIKYHNIHLFCR